jgi:hypothetical protein
LPEILSILFSGLPGSFTYPTKAAGTFQFKRVRLVKKCKSKIKAATDVLTIKQVIDSRSPIINIETGSSFCST